MLGEDNLIHRRDKPTGVFCVGWMMDDGVIRVQGSGVRVQEFGWLCELVEPKTPPGLSRG